MQVIPAIDIIDGKCVRLTKGDYSKLKIYYENPVDAAKAFEAAGLQRLHVVDLDGARSGTICNIRVLESIASATKLIIDFGGGIKNINDVSMVFNAGAAIVTLGSIAVKQPGIVEEWLMEFGVDKILVGADVLDGKIRISGWLEDGGVHIDEFIGNMLAIGVQNLFCTDISKDGMLEGPALDLYKKILSDFPDVHLTASGGINNIEDVKQLIDIGCTGAIIGKAIYEEKITLKELAELNF